MSIARREVNAPHSQCYRTVCTNVATCGPHKDLKTYYCLKCAKLINKCNLMILVPLEIIEEHIPANATSARYLRETLGLNGWSRDKINDREPSHTFEGKVARDKVSFWRGGVDQVQGFSVDNVEHAHLYESRMEDGHSSGRDWEHWQLFDAERCIIAECAYPT